MNSESEMHDVCFGPDFGIEWVDPTRTNTQCEHPYAYSPAYLWGGSKAVKGCQMVYSDRLYQWDYEKARKASDLVGKQWRRWRKPDAKKFLEAYFGGEVTPKAFAEGCNPSSGYPYWIFWFKRNPDFENENKSP